MNNVAFHLISAPFCPDAERAMIALTWRGTAVTQERRDGPARLVVRRAGAHDLHLTDPLVMLELIEDLHPDQPLHPRDQIMKADHRDLMARALLVQARLARVIAAASAQDLDLAVYFLRDELARIEPRLHRHSRIPGHGLFNIDIAFAPVLWRLATLDHQAGAFLLSGFPQLAEWAAGITNHAVRHEIRSGGALADWLDTLRNEGRAVVSPGSASLEELAASSGSTASAGNGTACQMISKAFPQGPKKAGRKLLAIPSTSAP
ncbi:MAG: hypothetical protein INF52_15150 [Rhodobacter sp.]|nr:hypothetical protein [Rhodobacter sp.]